MPFARQNPRRLSIFCSVLKHKAIKGRYTTEIFTFFIIVDECSLDTNVFMIIEILSKKYSGSRNFGESIVYIGLCRLYKEHFQMSQRTHSGSTQCICN